MMDGIHENKVESIFCNIKHIKSNYMFYWVHWIIGFPAVPYRVYKPGATAQHNPRVPHDTDHTGGNKEYNS